MTCGNPGHEGRQVEDLREFHYVRGTARCDTFPFTVARRRGVGFRRRLQGRAFWIDNQVCTGRERDKYRDSRKGSRALPRKICCGKQILRKKSFQGPPRPHEQLFIGMAVPQELCKNAASCRAKRQESKIPGSCRDRLGARGGSPPCSRRIPRHDEGQFSLSPQVSP